MADKFEVEWTGRAKRSLQRLPEKVAHAAIEFIYGSLADNPPRVGHKLRFELEGLYSARRGDHRVIYRIAEDSRILTIMAIEHRSDVYRGR